MITCAAAAAAGEVDGVGGVDTPRQAPAEVQQPCKELQELVTFFCIGTGGGASSG